VRLLALLPLAALLSGCGYHIAGQADMLPRSIRSIAIPAFASGTTRYRFTDRLPQAIAREFALRTRYTISNDPQTADAVLEGAILRYQAFPTVYDAAGSRASAVQVYVTLKITLRDRKGKVLFNRPAMEIRERYEISGETAAYFEESDVALERMSRDVARSTVSAVLENF
jgi:outer membrane lipopolysaccharide assembly protein LptE/RlpB